MILLTIDHRFRYVRIVLSIPTLPFKYNLESQTAIDCYILKYAHNDGNVHQKKEV